MATVIENKKNGKTVSFKFRAYLGRNEMPIRHLVELCKFYNVSADYILGLNKSKNNHNHR